MKKTLLLTFLAASAATVASGALIFYDGFLDGGSEPTGAQYNTSGSPAYLHNQNPTISPFNAAWFASNNFGTNANAGARLDDGLTYSGIPSDGAAVRMGRFGGSGPLALHNISRAADPALTAASSVYYGSFLLSMNENMFNATTNTQLFTQFSFIDNLGGSTRNLRLGVNASNQLFVAAGTGTTMSTTATSTDAVMSGHTDAQLVVFRILDRDHPDNSESVEQITVWLNPNLALALDDWANPLTINHDLLRTANGPNFFSGIGLFAQVNAPGHLGNFDEIRLATDLATAIPEPSTYAALFGLLAIGFVAWRRRRRA